MLAGPHGMKFTSRRSRMRCSALCTYTVDGKGTRISTQIARTSCPRAASRRARHAMRPFSSKAHLGRVDHALNDIQDGNVASLARRRRHHDIFRLRAWGRAAALTLARGTDPISSAARRACRTCVSLRMTSNTVVLRTALVCASESTSGV